MLKSYSRADGIADLSLSTFKSLRVLKIYVTQCSNRVNAKGQSQSQSNNVNYSSCIVLKSYSRADGIADLSLSTFKSLRVLKIYVCHTKLSKLLNPEIGTN